MTTLRPSVDRLSASQHVFALDVTLGHCAGNHVSLSFARGGGSEQVKKWMLPRAILTFVQPIETVHNPYLTRTCSSPFLPRQRVSGSNPGFLRLAAWTCDGAPMKHDVAASVSNYPKAKAEISLPSTYL